MIRSIIFISMVILFAFYNMPSVFGLNCQDTYEKEQEYYATLQLQITKQIQNLHLNDNDAVKFGNAIQTDPLGMKIMESKKCLQLFDGISINDDKRIDYSKIITTIGIVIAAVGVILSPFFINRGIKITEKRDHDEITKNGKTSIGLEIDDIEKTLKDKPSESGKGVEFQFSPFYLKTSAFESIIHSGSFLHFSVDLQNALSDLYFNAKQHNYFMDRLLQLTDKMQIYDLKPEANNVLITYYETINIIQQRILDRYIVNARSFL